MPGIGLGRREEGRELPRSIGRISLRRSASLMESGRRRRDPGSCSAGFPMMISSSTASERRTESTARIRRTEFLPRPAARFCARWLLR
jgi:hypothetical protein